MNDSRVPIKETSERREWRNLALGLFFMLVIFGFAFIEDRSRGGNNLGAPVVVAYVIGAFWFIRSIVGWIRADAKPLSPDDLKDFQAKLHGSAVARYSIGIVLICGALFIADAKPNAW